MVEQDTLKLLRECDAGVKMGTASIDDVMPHVKSKALLDRLNKCKDEHNKLSLEIDKLLDKYRDDGKDPNPIAKGMSWIKTNVKLAADDSDKTVAVFSMVILGIASVMFFSFARSHEPINRHGDGVKDRV